MRSATRPAGEIWTRKTTVARTLAALAIAGIGGIGRASANLTTSALGMTTSGGDCAPRISEPSHAATTAPARTAAVIQVGTKRVRTDGLMSSVGGVYPHGGASARSGVSAFTGDVRQDRCDHILIQS